MDILGNIQVLKEKKFWASIANANIEYIRPAITQWEKEQEYTNELLQFFREIAGFNYTEKDICFYTQNLKDILSLEDCMVLFHHIRLVGYSLLS